SLENVKLRFIGKYTKFTDIELNVPYQSQEALYGSKFPSSATGQGFDDGNTIRMRSKANGSENDDETFPGGFGSNDPAPFKVYSFSNWKLRKAFLSSLRAWLFLTCVASL